MRETVAKLVALQAIDDEGRSFHEERDGLQAKIVRLKELLGLMEEGLAEKRVKLDEASRWYREKDGELKVDQEKVAKAKSEAKVKAKICRMFSIRWRDSTKKHTPQGETQLLR